MIHHATAEFWACYKTLPQEVQNQADIAFQQMKADPKTPSLHMKKIGRFWSARVTRKHRALAVEHERSLIWFWIGPHDEYMRILTR